MCMYTSTYIPTYIHEPTHKNFAQIGPFVDPKGVGDRSQLGEKHLPT